jgi:hypothetical protein
MNEAWEKMFQALRTYHAEHGNCDVPSNTKGDYAALASWVRTQRERFKTGRLPKEQANRLSLLGFSWDPIGESWEQMFQELCEYYNTRPL